MKIEVENAKIETHLGSIQDSLHKMQQQQNGIFHGSTDTVKISERLAELEVKMSKLWSMLTEKTPTGQDKLNRFGRKFSRGLA